MRRRRVPIVEGPADLAGGDLVRLTRWASRGYIVDPEPEEDAPEAIYVASLGSVWSRLRAYEEAEVEPSRGLGQRGRQPGMSAATRPVVQLDPYWPAHNAEHNAAERKLRAPYAHAAPPPPPRPRALPPPRRVVLTDEEERARSAERRKRYEAYNAAYKLRRAKKG